MQDLSLVLRNLGRLLGNQDSVAGKHLILKSRTDWLRRFKIKTHLQADGRTNQILL